MNEQDRLLAIIETLEKKSQILQPMTALIAALRMQTEAITRLAESNEAIVASMAEDGDDEMLSDDVQYLGSKQ